MSWTLPGGDSVDYTGSIPKFGGAIYYVSASGADTNTGTDPDEPLKTIGAAIAKLSAGDAISIMAGTYGEVGIDLDVDNCEMWFEIGSILDPGSGVGLTVSGDYCKVLGEVEVQPTAAVGVLVSGASCVLHDIKVLGGTSCFQVTGSGCVIVNGAAGFPSASGHGFLLQGDQTRLYHCSTVGDTTSYGYLISDGADTGVLSDCTSVGHQTAGYYISTGSEGWTIVDCSSGSADGKWRDIDQANTWSNLSFDNIKTSTASLDANAETKSYNVARIYGTVKIKNIHIEVLTVLSADISDFFLDIYDGTLSVPISKNTTLDLDNAPAGSMIVRNGSAADVLAYASGAAGFILENASYRDPQTEVIVGEKGDDTATYLRMIYTTTDAPSSGSIRGYIEWEPITDDGFVEVV